MSTHAQVVALKTVAGPKQARSERTLYRLLDAAEALIQERGLGGVSIPEIVRRAGSSVGGFYARFRDKNELLRALEERFYGELDRRVEALVDEDRWRGVPTRTIVDAAVAELVTVTRERERLLAAFLFRAIQDPEVREDALRFRRSVTERFEQLLSSRRGEIAHAEPRLAIDLVIQITFAFMQEHVLFGETRAAGRALTDEEIQRELGELVLAYLGVREVRRVKGARAG
ncbi:MAG: TetR/AcrR family transcriptional regulator [Deltaproteobacteria bacterium]|nr:TetR/AcrR family transcriptional regulator [Deltaproteobacteria bacterium]